MSMNKMYYSIMESYNNNIQPFLLYKQQIFNEYGKYKITIKDQNLPKDDLERLFKTNQPLINIDCDYDLEYVIDNQDVKLFVEYIDEQINDITNKYQEKLNILFGV